MKINVAHIRERSTSGGWIDFVVFEATATSGGNSANDVLLQQLTSTARVVGLKVDQSALAYRQGGRTQVFGSKNLVNYSSRNGVSRWTHKIDA